MILSTASANAFPKPELLQAIKKPQNISLVHSGEHTEGARDQVDSNCTHNYLMEKHRYQILP